MAEAGVFTFSEEDVRSWCDGLTFARANALQTAGHVRAPILDGVRMSAEVQGTWARMDRPSIDQQGATLQFGCTCASPNLCRHGAAMLLHWIRTPDAFRRPRSEQTSALMAPQQRSLTPEQQMQELLYRYTMADLRALARTRGLSVKGQYKDEYVQRLAALLLRPEHIDPVLEGLGNGELILLTLIDVLRDGAGANAAGVRNAFDALWGRRHTDAGSGEKTVLENTLNRLEGLGLLIRPTYPGGMYDAPRAVTARTPMPQALLDLLPDRSADAARPTEGATPSVTLLDLIQMLAHEIRRGGLTAQLPPKPRTGYGQPPSGWEFAGRDEGHEGQGKGKRVPESVELRPQAPLVREVDQARLASQIGASEAQIEFAAELLVELDLVQPRAGGRGRLAVDEQRLGNLLTRDASARVRTLASAWLDMPEAGDFRVLRDVLELRMDEVRRHWYASEMPAERTLRSLMARFIGHLATAPPRWYAHSDLAGLCAMIAPERLYRGQHALDIWWFTPAGRPEIRLALNVPDGRTRVYGAILGALLRGPLRWLGMVDVVETAGELLFRPRPAAVALVDRDPDPATEEARAVSLRVEAEPDGTPIVTVASSSGDELALLLATVAEPLAPSRHGVRYRLSGPSLQRIFAVGVTGTGLAAWLERSSSTGMPESVRRRIEGAWETFGTVRLYDEMTLLELGDDLLLRELDAMSGLRDDSIHVFSPRLVAVAPERVSSLIASLTKAGYRPRVLEET